jgi:lipid II:glycine glycyltransferase (peptidoglycan interpeptide bridge formation enzyme)
LVRSGDTDLAGMILILHQGTATYLHGASSPDMREKMAPCLMHWAAIRTAKEAGCTTYDLWGTDLVQDQETNEWKPQEGHPSAGTSRFKLGFNGQVVEYPGAFDLILNPFCYTLYTMFRKLRGGKRAFR